MSEPKKYIKNVHGKVIAWSKHDVIWREGSGERIGSFAEDNVYDNNNAVIASLTGNEVVSSHANILGEIRLSNSGDSFQLLVNGHMVCECSYGKSMAIAVIALLGRELSENT